jgi:hypothetical protein
MSFSPLHFASMLTLVAVGCGGSVLEPTDGGSDGGPADASHPDASPPPPPDAAPPPIPDGGLCNTLAQAGSLIPLTAIATAPPPHSTGGAVSPGTYVLTSATMYTGNGGQTGNAGNQALTLLFTTANQGFDIQAVSDTGTGNTASSVTATISSSGTMTLAPYCPATGTPQSVSYSSTGGTLTFYVDGGGSSLVEVLTAIN